MSRIIARLIILLSVLIVLLLLIFTDQFLQKWLNWFTVLAQIAGAIGLTAVWKKQTKGRDLWVLWPLAILCLVFTVAQALATIPLHGIEARVHLARPAGLDESQFTLTADRSNAALLPAGSSGDSMLVFRADGLVIKWNDTLETVRIRCSAIGYQDSSGIPWRSGSYLDIGGSQVVDFNLADRRATVQTQIDPADASGKVIYRTSSARVVFDSSFVGSFRKALGVGGDLELSASKVGYGDADTTLTIDSSVTVNLTLQAGYAGITIETYNKGGNREPNAEVYVNDTLKFESFKHFSVEAFQKYKIQARLTVDNNQSLESDPVTLDIRQPIDTTLKLTLHYSH